MTDALWNKLGEGRWQAFLEGSCPAGYVHTRAIEVMNELDRDLSAHRSKHLSEFQDQPFYLVETVCDSAKESCRVFPGAKGTVNWPSEDPANARGSSDERLHVFRRVRDEIAPKIRAFLSGSG